MWREVLKCLRDGIKRKTGRGVLHQSEVLMRTDELSLGVRSFRIVEVLIGSCATLLPAPYGKEVPHQHFEAATCVVSA